MANTLTGLLPTIYEALDTVSRELVGFVPAVIKNSSAERAALGQVIGWPVVSAGVGGDFTPAAYGPDPTGLTATSPTVTLDKSKNYPFFLTGEEGLGLRSSGSEETLIKNEFAQAFRWLVNQIEADLFAKAYKAASRAYGTAGTLPFATANDFSDVAQLLKILKDNGAPTGNLHLVLSTAAGAKIRGTQALLLRVNESGSSDLLRKGVIGDLEGFMIHESAAVQKVTKGTGTLYVISGSTAVGVNTIALVTGSGTVLPGDVATFAVDAVNKYVINAGVAAPGTIQIGQPGAQVVIPTANAMTIGADYTPLVGFDGSALFLATRAPAMPARGDAAIDVITVIDPVSGLAFDIGEYLQYGRIAYDVRIVWGCAAVKSAHIATLLS